MMQIGSASAAAGEEKTGPPYFAEISFTDF